MKKNLLLLILAFCISMLSMGQAILYENFDYAPPAYIGGNGAAGSTSNNWTTHSVTPGQTTTVDIASGNLTYPGLTTSSGNKVYFFSNANATSRDVNQLFTPVGTPTVMYCSMLINVLDNAQIGTAYDYFFSFGGTSGSSVTSLFARLHIKSVNSGGNYRLGIQNNSGTGANQTELTTDLDFATTYLIVLKYDFNGAGNDIASLWVNPVSLGGSEPTGFVSNSSSATQPPAFASVCLRNNAVSPKADIDEIRVGTTWADVTPTGSIAAPTTQTSNFTFSNILQTQMNVGWTNGNGGKRVVKINTTNSFTAPADGTDPTANTVYSGSNEQVVYNGTGNSVPTITGLTSSTTYWFQAWEYNGSGSSTLYCSAVGANNPLSQATAATATPPIISSPTATAITAASAILGGNITADGGASITDRGTLWSLTSPVTIADNKLSETGTTIGVFTHPRTGLPVNTKIYYAAYATNSAGSALSPESFFNTLYGEPTNHADSFAATSAISSSVVNTWSDNDGVQPATGFLILANKTGVFVDPVDGVPVTNRYGLNDSSGAVNVAHGIKTFTWTGLTGSTQYYFAIYPYTNSGTNIDYKTLPTSPRANTTTQVFVLPTAAWTFDTLLASPNTPTSVISKFGQQAGTATLHADGNYGSSLWLQATELNSFAGNTTNDPREGSAVFAGASYCEISGGSGLTANGKKIVLKFSMSALQDPILTYATRYSSNTGFISQLWEWSTDGTNFTSVGGNLAPTSSTFVTKTLDLTAVDALDGAPNVYLRVTFNGATGSTSNNRIDNIVIRASAASTLPPTVHTTIATNVGANTATINGTVNANNQLTAVKFAYGLTTSYGDTVAAVPASVTGGITTPVSVDLAGLNAAATYHYKVIGTNASGSASGVDFTFTTTCLLPGDPGVIVGPTTVCANLTEYQYSTTPIDNVTYYFWTTPPGCAILTGDGTNSITVNFAPGNDPGTFHVYGTNDCGDESAEAQLFVSVSQPLTVEVSIAASANPVVSGTSVTFTATPVNEGSTPSYQWRVNGNNVGTGGTSYTYVPQNNDEVYCVLTSSEPCTYDSEVASNAILMTVTGTPDNRWVKGTISSVMALCFDAINTITVAGSDSIFVVQSGGSAVMVAGQKILYLPGTTVHSGGYMLGYIDLANPHCDFPKSPAMLTGNEESGFNLMDNGFKIYPNPTSGTFTVENLNETTSGNVHVDVVGTLGGKILSTDYTDVRKQELSIKGNPPGIYFVKVTVGEKVQTVKIILTK